MAHTRYRIDQMIGKRVHLILKNGEEFYGILGKANFREFGFSITYNVALVGNSLNIGNCRDFVLSEIKKIELENPMKDVEDFIERMNKFKSEVERWNGQL